MEKLNKVPPEILIYVQTVKQFLMNNEESRKYFQIDSNEEEFMTALTEIAQKNFDEFGAPELSLIQFEQLKQKVTKTTDSVGIFLNLGDYGLMSLN